MPPALYKKPFPGLVGLVVGFLSQWLGHAVWALLRGAFEAHEFAELLLGAVGFAIIWKGLKQNETNGTWMGILGGALIWVGWFEFTFDFFSKFFGLGDWASPNGSTGQGGTILLMSTMPLMLTMLLVYGFANRQTKCNFLRWFQRRFHVDPGKPTSGNGRSFARITAMEAIFVTWFCYQVWLYIGYLAPQWGFMAAYIGWAIWAVYIFLKLIKISRVALAFRYGLPVGIVIWGTFEMPSYLGFYDEYWLKPFEYPVLTTLTMLIFVGGFVYAARSPAALKKADPSS